MRYIALRFFMVVSLLVSMQASASMAVAMAMAIPDQPRAQTAMPAHCADMAGMTDKQHHASPSSATHPKPSCERCNTSCCAGFVPAFTSAIVPVTKYQQNYQATPVLPPSRFARINYRPPIFS